jgi:hypothetical protein
MKAQSVADRQIFLSYARVDDEIPPAADKDRRPGWVKFFYDNLWYELRQRVSTDLHFWRDVNDIEPDGVFAREIREALEQAIFMVAVLSPNYIERPWCRRELNDFIDSPPGVDPTPRSERIFKILKHNVPEIDLPPSLQNRGRGYAFYVIDPTTGNEQPFFMAGRLRTQYEQAYFDLINELAERIRARIPSAILPRDRRAPRRFVFVAPPPVGSSVMEIYSALTKQLIVDGFGVLPPPSEAFPDRLADAQRMLAEAIGPASLAIHLIGESSGKTCDGATEPMVPMQLSHSATAMRERPELRRLIWIAGKDGGNASHNVLLKAIADCNDSRAPLLPGRDEIVSGVYDSFLGLIQRTLRDGPPPPLASRSARTLWIVAADDDVAFARGEFRRALRGLGAPVDVPLPPNRPAEVRSDYEAKRLQTADSVIVLWGSQPVDWVEDQLYQLRQLNAARSRPFDGIALAVLAPDSDEKRHEEPAGPGETVIDLRLGLDDERLRPLVRLLGITV